MDLVGKSLYKYSVEVPGEAFENLHKIVGVNWSETDWTEKIVKEAGSITPWLSLRFSHVYKNKEFAYGVIASAAKKMPSFALEYANRYADQKFAADVVRIAAKEAPADAIRYFSKYSKVLGLDANKVLADARLVIVSRKNSKIS